MAVYPARSPAISHLWHFQNPTLPENILSNSFHAIHPYGFVSPSVGFRFYDLCGQFTFKRNAFLKLNVFSSVLVA